MTDTTKVWKSARDAASGIVLNEDSLILIGDDDNLIGIDDSGVTIKGPISLVAEARNIRKGGLFIGLNDFSDMIPSTVVTPIPKQIPMPPIQSIVGLATDVQFFMSLLV